MILNIASIVIAVVLVVVTYLYMRHTKRLADDTKRMADIMAEEFELRTAPFIDIELHYEFPSGAIGVKIFKPKITNKGFLPVYIVKIVLEWWYKKSPSVIYQKEISTKNCILGKNEYREFRLEFNKGDMIKDEESKNLDFPQLRVLSSGKIYAVYIDKNRNEQRTRDLYQLENL